MERHYAKSPKPKESGFRTHRSRLRVVYQINEYGSDRQSVGANVRPTGDGDESKLIVGRAFDVY